MWFKNLQIYRLTEPFTLTPEALHEALQQRPARECGKLEPETLGWAPPLGRQGQLLTHASGGCIMICAQRNEKVMPAAVVREQLAQKVEMIEEKEQRKVGRKEKLDLRDQLMVDLLPKAFTKSALTYAYIDTKGGWLLVDAASAKRAEALTTLLRDTLGTLPLVPLETNQSPGTIMTGWLLGKIPTREFQIMDQCELREPGEEGGIVRCRRQSLTGSEIQAHLDAGKQVVQLGLEWDQRIAFVLGEDLALKRLKFLDIIQDEAADTEAEDAAARFDVDFSLMSLELGRLLPKLVDTFGGLSDFND
jgi:recombination associated protein RdgC